MNATYDNYLLTDPIGSTEAAHNISDLRNRIVVTFVLELLSYRLTRSLLPDHNRPSTFAKPPYVSFTYEKKEGIRFYATVFSKICTSAENLSPPAPTQDGQFFTTTRIETETLKIVTS